MPVVSVVIPVHNGESTIPRAMASVFAQSYPDYEVIVVDDGSTDGTPAVLAGYGDRIRVMGGVNRGPSAARNTGVRASAGQYVAFLDDDDEWMPEKLARCVPLLDGEADCALVYTLVIKVDQQGRLMPAQSDARPDPESPTLKDLLASPWNVVPSQFVVRRDAFNRCGGFHERLIACEDLYFLLRSREDGHFRCVPQQFLRKEPRPPVLNHLDRGPNRYVFVKPRLAL